MSATARIPTPTIADPEAALEAVTGRRSVGKLTTPAPTDAELTTMLEAACTAPDHGRLRPWRFVVLRGEVRRELGDAFARAEMTRNGEAGDPAAASTKALRAPVIVTVIARTSPHPKVHEWEQLVAAGCAAQNLCIAATAHGYGSMWRTGWQAEHPEVLATLGLGEDERIVGFVYLGTVAAGFRPPPRVVDTSCVTFRD